MKKRTFIYLIAFATFTLLLFSTALVQQREAVQSQNYEQLARRIITTSVSIKPGDVVVVAGGKHTIPLMEALAIEAQKAGGLVTIFLSSDRVFRSYYVDVPEQYLEQEPRCFAEWLKQIDVFIGLPSFEDEKAVTTGVPEARFAKAAKAGLIIYNMLNESKVRLAFIGYPSKEDAANAKVDFSRYERMQWAAVNADYKLISEKGNALKAILKGAKTVRITSPSGADFSFSVGDRPVFVDDGIVTSEKAKSKFFFERIASLPGGQLFFAPIETSGNGKVIVPKTHCRFAPLTDVSFELKNGQMQNFKARIGGDCFTESMAPYSGPKDMLGTISIGLNPELKVIEDGGDYRPGNAAGMVWVNLGDNRLTGGNNSTQGGFGFPIVNATVTVDGKVVIKDGKLVF